METFLRLTQESKADLAIKVTVAGILTAFIFLPIKAFLPIVVTFLLSIFDGILTFVLFQMYLSIVIWLLLIVY